MSFEKLDNLISKNMPVDYWEDDQLFSAQEIVEDFSENDWVLMEESIPAKSSEWKCRLIQSIGDSKGNNVAIKTLLNFIEETNPDIVELAIDSLRNIIPLSGLVFSENQLKVIENLISKGGIAGRVANELKQKIKGTNRTNNTSS